MNCEKSTVAEKCSRLQEAVWQLVPKPGVYHTRIFGFTLYRREVPSAEEPYGWAEPHLTAVFQGAEHITLNGQVITCQACQCRVVGVTALGTGCIAAASSARPFLAASLSLDQGIIRFLASSLPSCARGGHNALQDASVATADTDILDAFSRLTGLLGRPAHIPVLAPLIIAEIHYRLLAGPHGARCTIPRLASVH